MDESLVGPIVIAVLALLLVGVPILLIVRGVRARAEANRRFLAGAVAATELQPGVPGDVAAPPGRACELWLDLSARAPNAIELGVSLAVHGQPSGSYTLTVDEEGDLRGLPRRYGIVERNVAYKSLPGVEAYSGAIWLASMDGSGPVHARVALTPSHGTTFERARLLVVPA